MFFLINQEKKICLGWSAKCACTHIKYLFNDLIGKKMPKGYSVHWGSHGELPENHNTYTNIIFIRNPYERLVSGFLNKFNETNVEKTCLHKYIKRWENNQISMTFTNVVNNLGNWELLNEHHFTPQLTEAWRDDINLSYIFDINSIDYNLLEKLFDKSISSYTKNKKYKLNQLKITDSTENTKLYDTDIYRCLSIKHSYSQFYNEDLKNKVYSFYKKDFDFFLSKNFKYNI